MNGKVPIRLNRWRRFSLTERCTIVIAMALLPLAATAVALCGVTSIARFIRAGNRRREIKTAAGSTRRYARDTACLVDIASRYGIFPGNCLSRALTLWCLLGWHEMPAVLHFGLARRDGRIAGHAWLEYDGEALGEPFACNLDLSSRTAGTSG